MLYGVEGTTDGGVVGLLRGPTDLAQPQGPQRVALLPVGAVGGLQLGDAHGSSHQVLASAGSAGSASSPAAPSPVPSNSQIDRRRSFATSSGERRFWSAVMVALTRLIGFCEPSDFDSTSRIPASSSTARTPPPAMTPVPSEAGFRKTRAAP